MEVRQTNGRYYVPHRAGAHVTAIRDVVIGYEGSYNVRSRARPGVGKPDTFEVTWTSAKGRTSVLTTHKTFEQATARLVYMRAPLGSPERDEAYRRFLAVGGAR